MLTKDIAYYKKQVKEIYSLLGFYTDEIKVLEHRLAEVAAKNTGREVLFQVEHFQNQFIIQAEQFNLLLNQARLLDAEAVKISEHETTCVAEFLMGQRRLQEKVTATAEQFRETKHSCYRFLSMAL